MLYSIRHGTASAFPQTFHYPSGQGNKLSRCPECGRDAIASNVPDRLPVEEGSRWPDVLTGPWPLIVTERVAVEFQREKLTGFTVEPVDILPLSEKLGLSRMPKYVGLRIDPWGIRCDPKKTLGIHHFKSPAKPLVEYPDLCSTCGVFSDLSDVTVKSLELDLNSWNNRDFCSWGMYVFVTDSVIRVALEKKFTNFHFTQPSEAWDVTAKSLKTLPKS